MEKGFNLPTLSVNKCVNDSLFIERVNHILGNVRFFKCYFLYSLIHARASVLATKTEKKAVRFTSLTEFNFKCKHLCFDFYNFRTSSQNALSEYAC